MEELFGEELSHRRLQFRATMETVVGHLELPEAWLPRSDPAPAAREGVKRAPAASQPPAPTAAGLGRHAVVIALALVAAAITAGALAASSCSRSKEAPSSTEPP